jgi:SAM-dependent methyltransferase
MPSIVFAWNRADFDSLLASCPHGPELPFIYKYMPRGGKILEAGCGLGVIEHFVEGPQKSLQEIRRVLRPGHHAVITVPSFNLIRKIKYWCGYHFIREKLKNNRFLRHWLKKERREKTSGPKFRPFHVFREKGKFFEYRFKKKEFEFLLEKAGFIVIESVPIANMDGIYHEFGHWLVSFRDWQFHPGFVGFWLNRCLSRFPFVHNHMHLCVVKKPLTCNRFDEKIR